MFSANRGATFLASHEFAAMMGYCRRADRTRFGAPGAKGAAAIVAGDAVGLTYRAPTLRTHHGTARTHLFLAVRTGGKMLAAHQATAGLTRPQTVAAYGFPADRTWLDVTHNTNGETALVAFQ